MNPLCQVLVVEDDETIRESVVDFLTDEGYSAMSAVHGGDALAKLKAMPELPALILLDLMMPVMDGRSFRQVQLGDSRLAPVPVVVISALADSTRQSDELKATAHLAKPFTLAALLSVVRRHCGLAIADASSAR